MFHPINNDCLNCGKHVDPSHDRQEIAFDDNGECRRRCGVCIVQQRGVVLSSTSARVPAGNLA